MSWKIRLLALVLLAAAGSVAVVAAVRWQTERQDQENRAQAGRLFAEASSPVRTSCTSRAASHSS
jgi:hypothetical protein